MPKLKKKSELQKQREARMRRKAKVKVNVDEHQVSGETENVVRDNKTSDSAPRASEGKTTKADSKKDRNAESQRKLRAEPTYRMRDNKRNAESHRKVRNESAFRTPERARDAESHRRVRNEPAFRTPERARDAESRRMCRKDEVKRKLENQCKRINNSKKQKIMKSSFDKLFEKYNERIQQAPSFICSCCGGLWYAESTSVTSAEDLKRKGCTDDLIATVLHVSQEMHRLCSTCRSSVNKKKIPKLALRNGLDFPTIPNELKDLSPLEERLVALRIPFMQIRLLGSERQSSLRGNIVNVENDLNICAAVLPRKFNDTSTIQVQLMRRMRYKSPYMYETIRPLKVYNAAKYLMTTDVYRQENIALSDDWSRHNDHDTINFICDESTNQPQEDDLEEMSPNEENVEEETNTAGVNETLIYSEKETADILLGVRIAPGEGKTPIALYADKNAEVMSFPSIYCGQERKFKEGVKLTYTDTIKSELRMYDRRACEPSKLLYSFKCSFNEKIRSAMQICLRKTTKNENLTAGSLRMDRIQNLLQHDDGYAVFKHLRSSPCYWKEQTKKLMAMIRQRGKPAFFITFSAAETKWKELIVMLHKIVKKEEISEDEVSSIDFEGIAKLIRKDPVTCMRHFDHRLRALYSFILKPQEGLFSPYELEDHFSRIEFQMRGSPHSHGLYWIKNAPEFKEDDDESIENCVNFINKFITCERCEDKSINQIIGYQIHKHSHTCKKRNGKCRFGFPKPPLDVTRILTPLPNDIEESKRKQAQQLLTAINEALEKLGRCNKDDIPLNDFLESLGTSYWEYITAIRSNIKRTTVFLRRSTNAIYVNPYNKNLLRAWGANIDFQFVIDTYACAKYCVGYMLKGEGGVSKLLQALTQDVKRGHLSAQEQLKKFASLLINGSEISAQEAAAFLLGIPNTNSSRQDVFINTSLPEERVSMLKSPEELDKLEENSKDIRCKGVIDYYVVRPPELDYVTLADFASMYEHINSSSETKQDNNELDNRNKRYKLLGNNGYVRKRCVRKVIRYRHYGKKEDYTNYCRERLMLFLPWKDEDEDLIFINSIQKAHQYQQELLTNSLEFIRNPDVDDNILADLLKEVDEEIANNEGNTPLVDEDLETLQNEEEQFFDLHDEFSTAGNKIQNFLPPKLVDQQQFLKIMRSLNEKQRRYVLHVLHLLKTSSTPFYSFLSGGAGVGKSHVITAIVQSYLQYSAKIPNTNPDQICCLVSAPTGKAAFNVFGMTLHCTFKLPPTQYGGRVSKLEEGVVNSLRLKLMKTKLFIIDEISMVSVKQLYDIDQRLKQIFNNSEDFGGKSIIVVGHLRQLAPIGGSYVFKPPKHLPLGELAGNYLWKKFRLFELEEIMRQKGDLQFCKALNNMSEGIMDHDDISLIRSREVNRDIQPPKEAIRLFQTNEECRIFNAEIHSELGTEGVMSTAYDKIQGSGSDKQKQDMKEYAKTLPPQKTDGLPYETHLQVGGEYFICTNVDVNDGLFNGSTGALKFIEFGTTAANVRLPICGWMDFRNPLIGLEKRKSKRCHQQKKGINLDWVGVDRITRNLSKNSKQAALEIIRTQIPLVAANGMTIAKSQGSSLPAVVVHVNKYKGKFSSSTTNSHGRKISRENLYVGCSRATSLMGLLIDGEFIAPEKPSSVDPVSLEMTRLRGIPFQFSIKFLQDYDDSWVKLYFHNIQSFLAHHADILADHCALSSNYIALVEPHALPRDDIERALPDFVIQLRANCRSVRNSEGALLFEKLGEVENTSTIVQHYSSAGHCLFVKFNALGVQSIMTYKSPDYSCSLFLQHLSNVIDINERRILLFGDINIDLRMPAGKMFRKFMEDLGFYTLLDISNASSDGGSHIDCCFSNFEGVEAWFYECYYSYHKPICIVWPRT